MLIRAVINLPLQTVRKPLAEYRSQGLPMQNPRLRAVRLSEKTIQATRRASMLVVLVSLAGCGLLVHEEVEHNDGATRQVGSVKVPGEQEQVVYYPIPYVSPPNVRISDSFD